MLDDEHRLAAMIQLLAFSRRHGETINGTLARYEVVRQRAEREGHFCHELGRLRAPTVASMQRIISAYDTVPTARQWQSPARRR